MKEIRILILFFIQNCASAQIDSLVLKMNELFPLNEIESSSFEKFEEPLQFLIDNPIELSFDQIGRIDELFFLNEKQKESIRTLFLWERYFFSIYELRKLFGYSKNQFYFLANFFTVNERKKDNKIHGTLLLKSRKKRYSTSIQLKRNKIKFHFRMKLDSLSSLEPSYLRIGNLNQIHIGYYSINSSFMSQNNSDWITYSGSYSKAQSKKGLSFTRKLGRIKLVGDVSSLNRKIKLNTSRKYERKSNELFLRIKEYGFGVQKENLRNRFQVTLRKAKFENRSTRKEYELIYFGAYWKKYFRYGNVIAFMSKGRGWKSKFEMNTSVGGLSLRFGNQNMVNTQRFTSLNQIEEESSFKFYWTLEKQFGYQHLFQFSGVQINEIIQVNAYINKKDLLRKVWFTYLNKKENSFLTLKYSLKNASLSSEVKDLFGLTYRTSLEQLKLDAIFKTAIFSGNEWLGGAQASYLFYGVIIQTRLIISATSIANPIRSFYQFNRQWNSEHSSKSGVNVQLGVEKKIGMIRVNLNYEYLMQSDRLNKLYVAVEMKF